MRDAVLTIDMPGRKRLVLLCYTCGYVAIAAVMSIIQ
jgi:hypothetical protein